MILVLGSCHRKSTPASSRTEKTTTAPVKQIRTPTPKVIVVNDQIASKTVDGRLYYDLEGHRYWRNYKDGKYYIYNKSMHNNPDFKKPR